MTYKTKKCFMREIGFTPAMGDGIFPPLLATAAEGVG